MSWPCVSSAVDTGLRAGTQFREGKAPAEPNAVVGVHALACLPQPKGCTPARFNATLKQHPKVLISAGEDETGQFIDISGKQGMGHCLWPRSLE